MPEFIEILLDFPFLFFNGLIYNLKKNPPINLFWKQIGNKYIFKKSLIIEEVKFYVRSQTTFRLFISKKLKSGSNIQ